MAVKKLKQLAVGTYPKADIIKLYLTDKEYKYFKKNHRFSGGTARRKLNDILDLLYEWEYDQWSKSYVINKVLKVDEEVLLQKTERVSYSDLDKQIAEILAPLLFADIIENQSDYEAGVFDNALANAMKFQNRNYYVYDQNKEFVNKMYEIPTRSQTMFANFVLNRRTAIINNILKIGDENGLFEYEKCWISQKFKTELSVEKGKFVIDMIKDKPKKAPPYHVKMYKENGNRIKKELGINNGNPNASKLMRKYNDELKDFLMTKKICAFFKGIVLTNVDINKMKEFLSEAGIDVADGKTITAYKKENYGDVRKLLVECYGRKTSNEQDVVRFKTYVNTVVGEPFTPIEREIEMSGIDPSAVIKYNTKTFRVPANKIRVVEKEATD